MDNSENNLVSLINSYSLEDAFHYILNNSNFVIYINNFDDIKDDNIHCFIKCIIEGNNHIRTACRENKVELLKLFNKCGYKINSLSSFHDSAYYDNIECLKFLHECGNEECDSSIINGAILNNSVECLKFLVDNGYKFTQSSIKLAKNIEQNECYNYLTEHILMNNLSSNIKNITINDFMDCKL